MDDAARARIVTDFSARVDELVREAAEECEGSGCGSPIETMLLSSWVMLMRMLNCDAYCSNTYSGQGAALHIVEQSRATSRLAEVRRDRHRHEMCQQQCIQNDWLFVQPTIGNYRVDAVMMRVGERTHEEAPDLSVGPVVIECDGAAYHDATVEQLARDRERDRVLQTEGFHVLRFTGKEIYRSPLACCMTIERWFQAEHDRHRAEAGR